MFLWSCYYKKEAKICNFAKKMNCTSIFPDITNTYKDFFIFDEAWILPTRFLRMLRLIKQHFNTFKAQWGQKELLSNHNDYQHPNILWY